MFHIHIQKVGDSINDVKIHCCKICEENLELNIGASDLSILILKYSGKKMTDNIRVSQKVMLIFLKF